MVRVCVPAVLLVAGCGFHLPGPGTNPGTDGATPGDTGASDDAPSGATCFARWLDHTVAFENIHRITALGSSALDRDPYISHDQRSLFFSTERDAAADANVYVARRASVADEFAAPEVVAMGINSRGYDTRIALSRDELTVIVSSTRDGGLGQMDFWTGTRSLATADFSVMTEAPFAQINDAMAQLDPELSADGKHLYFAPPGGPTQHIVVSHLNGTTWDPPVDVPGINDVLQNADPTLSPDERILVFSSNRTGSQGFDLWYATRSDANATFEPPRRLDMLGSSGEDGDPSLSADGCHIYFASNRQGSNYEIFTADVAP